MRVLPRCAAAPIAGLAAGLAAALAAASTVRSSFTDAELLWKVVPVHKLAIWILAGAHRVPLRVQVQAGLRSGGLSDLIGRRFRVPEVALDASVLVVPVTVLVVVATVSALVARGARPSTTAELWTGAALAGAVHAIVLGALAAIASSGSGFEGRFVQAGVTASPMLVPALVLGFVFGGGFALAGMLGAGTVALHPHVRAVGSAWVRALAAAAVVAAAVSLLATVVHAGGGAEMPGGAGSAVAAGALLGANVLAGAIVLAHGAWMTTAFAAGPFAGWARIDYLHFGRQGRPAPAVWWLLLTVPVAAGVVAGRAARRRGVPAAYAAAGFAAAWGATLAVLAWLLRVRMLTDFGLGRLADAGSAEAHVPIVAAALLGAAWGAVTAAVGAATVRGPLAGDPSGDPAGEQAGDPAGDPVGERSGDPAVAPVGQPGGGAAQPPPAGAVPAWTCPRCGYVNGAGSRFCGGCGYRGWN